MGGCDLPIGNGWLGASHVSGMCVLGPYGVVGVLGIYWGGLAGLVAIAILMVVCLLAQDGFQGPHCDH